LGEKLVDEGRLTVVNVGDDGDVAQRHGKPFPEAAAFRGQDAPGLARTGDNPSDGRSRLVRCNTKSCVMVTPQAVEKTGETDVSGFTFAIATIYPLFFCAPHRRFSP
ncbi:MAG: hypothetical protein Q8S47_02615, partial [Phenylobacterium sp.]|nr:hypothetical protein [Phenylobacterium sp.]